MNQCQEKEEEEEGKKTNILLLFLDNQNKSTVNAIIRNPSKVEKKATLELPSLLSLFSSEFLLALFL